MAPSLRRGVSVSSSSSSEDLVDSILAQAMDQVALEQIAALNTAHLGDDSLLPDHLESRFRKLKSFPGAAAPEPRARTFTAGVGAASAAAEEDRACHSVGEREPEKTSERLVNESTPPPPKRSPPPLTVEPGRVGDKAVHTPPAAAADSRTLKHGSFLPSPQPASFSRSRSSSHSPRLNFRSPSPPRGLTCCFGLSPKSLSKLRSSGRKSVDGRRSLRSTQPRELSNGGAKEWDIFDDDDLLADLKLGTESIKEQGKRMKRALREQAMEAEKIVELVKQASARMEYSAAAAGLYADDLLSDEEKENRI